MKTVLRAAIDPSIVFFPLLRFPTETEVVFSAATALLGSETLTTLQKKYKHLVAPLDVNGL